MVMRRTERATGSDYSSQLHVCHPENNISAFVSLDSVGVDFRDRS